VIALTVQRLVAGQPKTVVARYDEEHGYWLCEDPDFYRVLRSARLPEDYYPDEALALVNYVAQLYHGEVMDLRQGEPHKLEPGEVF
jgi:hypothetical protein